MGESVVEALVHSYWSHETMRSQYYYKIQQGDSTETVAANHGYYPATIWYHPANRRLREERSSLNILLPGDKLFIPSLRLRQESVATGSTNYFRRKGIPSRLRIQILNNGRPEKHEPFILTLDSGETIEGSLDSSGWINCALPIRAREGKLSVGTAIREQTFHILLGYLDPEQETSGALARLRNLGYSVDETEDLSTDRNVCGIVEFQLASGLEPNGMLDEQTLRSLVNQYGC